MVAGVATKIEHKHENKLSYDQFKKEMLDTDGRDVKACSEEFRRWLDDRYGSDNKARNGRLKYLIIELGVSVTNKNEARLSDAIDEVAGAVAKDEGGVREAFKTLLGYKTTDAFKDKIVQRLLSTSSEEQQTDAPKDKTGQREGGEGVAPSSSVFGHGTFNYFSDRIRKLQRDKTKHEADDSKSSAGSQNGDPEAEPKQQNCNPKDGTAQQKNNGHGYISR